MINTVNLIALPVKSAEWKLYKAPLTSKYYAMHTTLGVKIADDVTFEQNFFQLAYGYIKDKIPNLLKFMLGFEVTKKNDDGTQAVGLFRFQVSGRELYVPVFYKGGELKGADLLFDKDQDKFIPNKENWVDNLLNARPTELGGASDMGIGSPDMAALNAGVDMSRIYNPTMNTKLGMHDVGRGPSWTSLLDFIKVAGASTAVKFINTLATNPKLHKAATDFYGDELYEAIDTAIKSAAEVMETEDVVEPNAVVTIDSAKSVMDHLDDKERKALLEDGVAFAKVDETKARIPYKVETTMKTEVLDGPCVVDVLMRSGQTEEVIALPAVIGNPNSTVIISKNKKRPLMSAETSRVIAFAKEDAKGDDFAKFFDSLPDCASAKVDDNWEVKDRKVYKNVFITENGQCTPPVALDLVIKNDDDITFNTYLYLSNPNSVSTGDCVNHIVISKAHKRMQIIDDIVYVPATAKVYTQKVDNDKAPPSAYDVEGDRLPIELGDQRILEGRIRGLYDKVKVSHSILGYSVNVNDKRLVTNVNKTSALIALVKQANIAPSYARSMLPQINVSSEFKFKKQAAGFDPGTVFAPPMPPVPTGMNPILGVQEQYPQSQTMNAMIPPSNQNVQNQTIMDSLTGMNQSQALDPTAVESIMQAAQTGQRDVFDVSTIGELLNKADIDTPIEKFMVDLNMGLDRLGRLYFLMLYHGDKFAERYSQDDLPSLEESIRDTFINLGEIILKLKERKIEADSGSAIETELNEMV